MAETLQFAIGAEVVCDDGVCGELTRVVVDPIARSVTDLVVEPKHRRGLGRLVPIDLIGQTDEKIQIRCTQVEFDNLEAAEETKYLPGSYGYGKYGSYSGEQVIFQPYYGLGMGTMGLGGLGGNATPSVTYDMIPLGDVAVSRGETVHATDGDIGKVQGLVIDSRSHHVTHVLLQEGHLWGQKQVAIPISVVTRIEDKGACLNLTKDQVRDLPAVDVDQHE